MKTPWLAIVESAPPEFEFRQELHSRDLRRAVFALFAESIEQALTALEPFRGKVVGLVVTYDATSVWEDRGDGIYHLAIPPQLQCDLQNILRPPLAVLQQILELTDVNTSQRWDLKRAAEDRARLVHEFSDMRKSLLKEIEERRVAQDKLQEAHDELEVRVQERTADLAVANEALQQAWKELTRSHKKLIKAHEELEADLDLAREFQVALLPDHDPEYTWGGKGKGRAVQLFHFYEPSGTVGGDFFHLLPFSDKKIGIFFCDVMGHGVRSALISGILRGLIEELKIVGPDPGRLLAAINKGFNEVLQASGETMFATAFLMVMDLEKLELSYANAGHPHPFHLKQSRKALEPLPGLDNSSGPALGLLPDVVFDTLKCEAELGDSVIIFTDGIFEVIGPDGDEFGEEQLMKTVEALICVPIPDLLGRVVERSRNFAAKGEFEDDVCLVAMKLSGEKMDSGVGDLTSKIDEKIHNPSEI